MAISRTDYRAGRPGESSGSRSETTGRHSPMAWRAVWTGRFGATKMRSLMHSCVAIVEVNYADKYIRTGGGTFRGSGYPAAF